MGWQAPWCCSAEQPLGGGTVQRKVACASLISVASQNCVSLKCKYHTDICIWSSVCVKLKWQRSHKTLSAACFGMGQVLSAKSCPANHVTPKSTQHLLLWTQGRPHLAAKLRDWRRHRASAALIKGVVSGSAVLSGITRQQLLSLMPKLAFRCCHTCAW